MTASSTGSKSLDRPVIAARNGLQRRSAAEEEEKRRAVASHGEGWKRRAAGEEGKARECEKHVSHEGAGGRCQATTIGSGCGISRSADAEKTLDCRASVWRQRASLRSRWGRQEPTDVLGASTFRRRCMDRVRNGLLSCCLKAEGFRRPKSRKRHLGSSIRVTHHSAVSGSPATTTNSVLYGGLNTPPTPDPQYGLDGVASPPRRMHVQVR